VTLGAAGGHPLDDVLLWLKVMPAMGEGRSAPGWTSPDERIMRTSILVGHLPASRPSPVHGRPVIRFDGQNDFLFLPDFLSWATQAEVFVVLKVRERFPATSHALWQFSTRTPASGTHTISILTETAPYKTGLQHHRTQRRGAGAAIGPVASL